MEEEKRVELRVGERLDKQEGKVKVEAWRCVQDVLSNCLVLLGKMRRRCDRK